MDYQVLSMVQQHTMQAEAVDHVMVQQQLKVVVLLG
jgi:hypothetical protein